MYWDDLRKFIHTNRAPGTEIKYWYNPKADKNRISIMDRSYPRRKGLENDVIGGWSEDDHWLNSQVGDAAFFGGEIPIENPKWAYDEERNKFVAVNHRGALSILRLLVDEGCVQRNDDVRNFFRQHGERI